MARHGCLPSQDPLDPSSVGAAQAPFRSGDYTCSVSLDGVAEVRAHAASSRRVRARSANDDHAMRMPTPGGGGTWS
jgi:hypothetical protein